MVEIDDYVVDVLMRDLAGHDNRPASFLVFLWLLVESKRRRDAVEVSYQELAETVGVSKSSAQTAVAWLKRRKLLTAEKATVTTVPRYTVHALWAPAVRPRRANARGAALR